MSEVAVAIISGAVALLGGVIGYKGAVAGAKKQIEHEREAIKINNNEQREFAINIINSFIADEIKSNFAYYKNDELSELLKQNNTPFFRYIDGNFNSIEFDKVKYELLKYSGNAVKEIIDIYKVFKILSNKSNVNKLSLEEYQEFKRVYNICLSEYSS